MASEEEQEETPPTTTSFIPVNETQYFDFPDKVDVEQNDVAYYSGTEKRSTFIDVGHSSDEFSDVFDHTALKEELNVDAIIPDGLLSSTIKLREFLKEYYRFLQKRTDSGSYVINNELLSSRDIDDGEDFKDRNKKLFFEFALNEYAEKSNLFFDKRSFLKNAVDFFSQKGTEDGFRNILKVLLKDFSTRFYEPWTRVLHTSQGDWSQERFITVRLLKNFFNFDNEDSFHQKLKNFAIFQEADGSRYNKLSYIEISRFEKLNEDTLRLYTTQELSEEAIQQDQWIIGVDDTAEVVLFEARITDESLKDVEIIYPGSGWREGQIIVFPGTKKDTILKVTKTKIRKESGIRVSDSCWSDGSHDLLEYAECDGTYADRYWEKFHEQITNIQIIDPGYFHSTSALSISPYAFKPASSETFVNAERQDQDPFGIDYHIVIRDNTDQTTETIRGTANGTYFYNVYDLTDGNSSYTASSVIEKEIIYQNTEAPLETSISFEEWQDSVATVNLVYGTVGQVPGLWETERSALSSQDTKTQDNFFYQIFSYVISSNENPDEYKDFAFLFHPAGLKRFMEYRNEHKIFLDQYLAQTERIIERKPLNPLCWDDGTYDKDIFDSCEGAFPNVCWDREDYDEEEYDFGFCVNAYGDLCWYTEDYESESYSEECA